MKKKEEEEKGAVYFKTSLAAGIHLVSDQHKCTYLAWAVCPSNILPKQDNI